MSIAHEPESQRTSDHSPAGTSKTELYDRCLALASNLCWSWNNDVKNLFRDLDPIRWRELEHNPIALLKEFTPDRLDARASEMVLYSRINHAYRMLKDYMSEQLTWAASNAGRSGCETGCVFFCRVWNTRITADLFGRSRSLVR